MLGFDPLDLKAVGLQRDFSELKRYDCALPKARIILASTRMSQSSVHTLPSLRVEVTTSPGGSAAELARSPRAALSAKARIGQPKQTGFTLLEILTAMALFFMVAGILVSGVSQAIRVAEVGAVESSNSRDQAMRLAWFRETVGLTVLPPPGMKPLDRAPPLVGDVRSLAGLSIAVANAETRGPAPYRFEIGYSADKGEGELRLVDGSQQRGAGSKPAAVLAAWRGAEGRFFFLDEDGVWQDQWPARGKPVAARSTGAPLRSELPLAIEFKYGLPAKSVLVAIQDRALPPPTLSELSK
ncbi:MAG: type II secretion system protein J [Burkholderiales bacterium]|jgi:hypothetical protein|nr:prepilin-type N-terminal cleavage/methylation domain-containing protein [Betaproteobacteria bacterium]